MIDPMLIATGLLIGAGFGGIIFMCGYSFGREVGVRVTEEGVRRARLRSLINRVPDDPGPEVSRDQS